MSTSFNLAFDDIYRQAVQMAGGERASGSLFRESRIAMQVMLRDWRNRGVMLWTVTPLSVPLVAGQAVYTMPADCDSVLDLSLSTSDGTTLEVAQIGRTTYSNISAKAIQGRPNQAYVNRQVGSTTATVYPVPDSADTYVLQGFYARMTADIPTGGSGVDAPTRFLDALVNGLAFNIAKLRPEIGLDRIAFLKQEYEDAFERAIDNDQDRAPIEIVPDMTSYWR